MRSDAPLDYVQWYYNLDHERWSGFPDVTAFMDSFLAEVDGAQVLNAGCGPQFFDVLFKFAELPERYVGVDISEATLTYLETATDPRLVKVREAAARSDVETEPLCADIFDCADRFRACFDTILAIGFIGTFHDEALDRLMLLLWDSLKPGGRLIKMTWHGPHRTPEQTAEKLKYGYDSQQEHQPQAFLSQIERAGFTTLRHEIFDCDPDTYRWDIIQGCVFQRSPNA